MRREPPVDYVKHGAVRLAIRRSVIKMLVRDPNVSRVDGKPPKLIYKDYVSYYVDARAAGRGRPRGVTIEEAKAKGKPIAKELAEEGWVAIELSPEERRMSEGAVKVALHRMRQRLGELVAEEIKQTVTNQLEWRQELKYLLDLLSSKAA